MWLQFCFSEELKFVKIFMPYCLILTKLHIQSFPPKWPKQLINISVIDSVTEYFCLSIILSHLLKIPPPFFSPSIRPRSLAKSAVNDFLYSWI